MAIVFTREPVPGAVKTRLIGRIGARNAAVLADAFTRDALAKVRSLGMPIVIAASASGGASKSRYFRTLASRFDANLTDQGTGHLGVRMERALAPYIETGAILIGTDTPSLPPMMLWRSVVMLRRVSVVIGPSLDGGYYLIGARGVIPDIFKRIRWGGSRVLEHSLIRLRRDSIRYALGPSWYDVDRWGDLMLLGEHLRRMTTRGSNPCPTTTGVMKRLGLLPSRG